MIIFSFNGIKKHNLKLYTSWCIHLLTCSGLVAGFLSLINVFENNQAGAFLWLGVALIIDAIDGSLARKFEVAKNVKNIDGKMLDSVIDFFNYIIIPSIMIYWFDIVPMYFEIVIPLIILVISAISYSNNNLMSSDNFYKGFPCIWNILLLYIYFFDFNSMTNLFLISFCIILKFIPLKYVHPLRVKKYKIQSTIFMALWFISTLKLLITSIYKLDNLYDYLVITIWVMSNFYFISLTIYELLIDIFKSTSIKLKKLQF